MHRFGGGHRTPSPFREGMLHRDMYTAVFAKIASAEDDEGDNVSQQQSCEDTARLSWTPYRPCRMEKEAATFWTLRAYKGKGMEALAGFMSEPQCLHPYSLVMDVCEGVHLRRIRV